MTLGSLQSSQRMMKLFGEKEQWHMDAGLEGETGGSIETLGEWGFLFT